MHKIVILCCSIFLWSASRLSAQDVKSKPDSTIQDSIAVLRFAKIDTLVGEVFRNHPEKIKVLAIGLQPIDFSYSIAYQLNLGYGANIEYTHGTKFGLRASYLHRYVNTLAEGASYDDRKSQLEQAGIESRALPVDFVKGMELGFNGWIALKNKTREGNVHEFFKGIPKSSIVSDKSADINGKYIKSFALRLGAQFNTALAFDDNKGFGFESGDIVGFDLTDVQTLVRSADLYIGVAFRTCDDVKLTVQSGPYQSKQESTSYKEIYIDALYAPKFELGEVNYYREGAFVQQFNLDATETVPYGARIGLRSNNLNRFIGTSLYAEGGLHPSFKRNSLSGVYFKAGFSVLFGGKWL